MHGGDSSGLKEGAAVASAGKDATNKTAVKQQPEEATANPDKTMKESPPAAAKLRPKGKRADLCMR